MATSAWQAKDDVEARLVTSIEGISRALRSSANNTKGMEASLRAFEGKVDQLELAVQPIHDLTDRLALAQQNINSALVEFERIHAHFRTADEVHALLSDSSLIKSTRRQERARFYAAAEAVCESRAFLAARQAEFLSAPAAVQQLDALRRFAIDSICIEYEVLTERNAATTMDYVSPVVDGEGHDGGQGGDGHRDGHNLGYDYDNDSENVLENGDRSANGGGGRMQGRYEPEAVDVIALHESFPADVSVQLREFCACVERCGLRDIFVDTYARSRGRVATDAIEEVAQLCFAGAGLQTSQNELSMPSLLGGVTVRRMDESGRMLGRGESGRSFFQAGGGSGGGSGNGRPPLLTSDSSFARRVAGDDGSSTGSSKSGSKWASRMFKSKKDGGSPSSAMTSSSMSMSMSSRLKQKVKKGKDKLRKHQHQQQSSHQNSLHKASMRSFVTDTSGALSSGSGGSGGGTRGPGDADGGLNGSGSGSGSGASARRRRKYAPGSHGMHRVMQLAAHLFEAELLLAAKTLPGGYAGRRIFLEAMVGPCETLASVGNKAALEHTKETYAETEVLFAISDVLHHMNALRPRLHAVLAPDSLAYLSERTAAADDGGGRRARSRTTSTSTATSTATSTLAEEMPGAAWGQVLLLLRSWKNEAVASMHAAYKALLAPLPLASLPPSASVHPRTTKMLNFLARLAQNGATVRMLLSPPQAAAAAAAAEGELAAAGREDALAVEFRSNVEQLVAKYMDNVEAVAQATGDGEGGGNGEGEGGGNGEGEGEGRFTSVGPAWEARTRSALFALNNLHYFVQQGVCEDPGILGVLRGPPPEHEHGQGEQENNEGNNEGSNEENNEERPLGRYLESRLAAVEVAKQRYVRLLLGPMQLLLADGQPAASGADLGPRSLTPAAKKALREYCAGVRAWIESARRTQSRLEVPDFALRTELRFRVRAALCQGYARVFDAVRSHPYVEKKRKTKAEEFLPMNPDVFSTLVSQLYEVSESASSANTLAANAPRPCA